MRPVVCIFSIVYISLLFFSCKNSNKIIESKEFTDILKRVTKRDSATQAILLVQSKPLSTSTNKKEIYTLSFTIKDTLSGEFAKIILNKNFKINSIEEQYLLKTTPRILTEIERFDLLKFRATTTFNEKLKRVTNSKITIGMTRDSVRSNLGEPNKIIKYGGARLIVLKTDYNSWVYDEFFVGFDNNNRVQKVFEK